MEVSACAAAFGDGSATGTATALKIKRGMKTRERCLSSIAMASVETNGRMISICGFSGEGDRIEEADLCSV
jgi:hypothetical protein